MIDGRAQGRGLKTSAGRTRSNAVGTAGDILKETLRPIHGPEVRFRPDGLQDKRKNKFPRSVRDS